MKTKKRILAMIMAAVLAFGMTVPGFAAYGEDMGGYDSGVVADYESGGYADVTAEQTATPSDLPQAETQIITFTSVDFPSHATASVGASIAFSMDVTVTSPGALSAVSHDEVVLRWYQDGQPRTDMGDIVIDEWQLNSPIRAELRFDTVWATDGGVWTLRAFYDGSQFVESPYSLDLTVAPIGIMPLNMTLNVSHDGLTVGGLHWTIAQATPTNPVTAMLTGSFILSSTISVPPNSTINLNSDINGPHTITIGSGGISLPSAGSTLNIGNVIVNGGTFIVHNSGDLAQAIALIGNGTGTIRLGANLTGANQHNAGIAISGGANITFDLNGHDLTVTAPAGHGMQVSGAGTEVNVIGTGTMNVGTQGPGIINDGLLVTAGADVNLAVGTTLNVSAANGHGVYVSGAASSATVTNATGGNASGTFVMPAGALAENGGSIIVMGNAIASGNTSVGAEAFGSASTVTVHGNVEGVARGAHANGAGSQVNVTGYATASGNLGQGARAENGGEVNVNGDAEGVTTGAFATGAGSIVNVTGNATATGVAGDGARAQSGGEVNVDGNAISTNDGFGAVANGNGSLVTVEGNASATGSFGIGAAAIANGQVVVRSNVSGEFNGPFADNGTVIVEGNVTVTSAGRSGAEVLAGGNIRIDGTITAPVFARVVGVNRAQNSYDFPTDLLGYFTYRSGTNWVRVQSTYAAAAPVITATANRTSATNATITIDGTIGGNVNPRVERYWQLGGPTPTAASLVAARSNPLIVDNIGGASSNTITLTTLPNDGAHTLYIAAQTGEGRITNMLTVTIPAFVTAPTITSANSTTFTTGIPGTFTVTASNNPTHFVRGGDALPPGLSFFSSTGALTGTPTSGTEGTYNFTFTAENAGGTSAVQNFTLTVNAGPSAPTITTQPTNQNVQAGDTVTFTAAATGVPTPTLQWQVSTNGGTTFTNISGETSATLTLNNVTTAMSGNQYRLLATNSVGTGPSNSVTLTVTAAAPTVTSVTVTPANVSVNRGSTRQFSATVQGTNSPSQAVTWSVTGNSNVNTTISASGLLTVESSENLGNITVRATSVANTAHFGTATVTITTPPPATDNNDTSDSDNWQPTNATISPSNVNYDIASGNDITVTLTNNTRIFRNLRFGTTDLVRGADYTVNGNRITIGADFLSTLEVGVRNITFVMSGGSNPTLRVTVTDSRSAVTTPDPTLEDDTPPNVNYNPPTGREPMPLPFADVNPNDWFYPFVRAVWEQQLFNGVSPTAFHPQRSMTRAMFVQVLANMEGVDLTAYQAVLGTGVGQITPPRFYDTSPTAWYYGAVEWAASQGLVYGIGGGNFAPSRAITRQEMAVMLNNYIVFRGIELPNGATGIFTDQDNISAWALEGVLAIQAAGIITGYPDGSFQPQGTATRAEVATIFARFLEVADMPRRERTDVQTDTDMDMLPVREDETDGYEDEDETDE